MIAEYKAKYRELEAKKRSELESALERGEVHDPISAIFTLTTLYSVLASAAVSAASYAISRALAPKPARAQIGKLQGTLQLQNSEQGIMIPEIYGAGPTASTVAGSNPTYQNLTNCASGGDGSITKNAGVSNNYNAGASHNVTVTTGQDAFIRVIRGSGFAAAGFFNTASPTGAGADASGMIFGVAWHPAGPFYPVINGVGIETGNTASGDTFTIEVRAGRFHLYKDSAEVTTFGSSIPAQPASMWFGVIMHTTGAGVSNAKVQINGIGDPPNFGKGGIKVPAIIDWSSGIRKHVSITEQPTGGGKGFGGGGTQTVENTSYDIDLGLTFAIQGPYDFLRLWANADVLIDQTSTSLLLTGVYNPGTGADPTYDPELPPDPTVNYTTSLARMDMTIPFDAEGVGTGTIQGGGAGFALYSGTATQEPDPTEEADVDARHGAGSTTAHRGKARAVLSNFFMTRWGGIVPNMTAAIQHQSLVNLSTIYGSLCERVNVLTANGDYDFSGLATIKSRGMLIAGRLFSPAEIIGSPEIQTVYNYFVTEAEGQLKGFIEGTEPSVTIADTEVGWMDSDSEVADVLPEVETIMASEIGLSRQVDVKYIDLDNEWEPNTQSDNRQITEGVTTEVMEVQLALLASEARAAAQRKLYRDYVAGSAHKFTLPWTYLYLYPGYKITITRLEGFSHVLKLTSISGGLGVLECEGVALEPAAFTQPAVGSILLGNPELQPIPAMTVLTLLDTPLLRDGDNSNGMGFYACGTPRTGVGQSWLGFTLYRSRNNVWGLIGSSDLPATIGTIINVSGQAIPTNIVGGSVVGNVFTKSSTNGAWDAGWFSTTSIIGNGYIQWTATSPVNHLSVIGLSTADVDVLNTSIQFGWYLDNLTARIVESGVDRGSFGAFVDGVTTFKIERVGTTLTYYKDGIPQRTVAGVTTSPLFVDTAHFTTPGTSGPITMSALTLGSDPSVWDRTGTFVVDLYGTSASLSSVTEQDILADGTKNLALFGNMVGQFATATQVAGFPNRWALSTLLNGRRGTENRITESFTGKRFVLINSAVVFVPAMATDIDSLFNYRGVTSGQSLEDAATVSFVWTGRSLKPLAPVNLRGKRDSLGNLYIQWTRRSRIAHGLIPRTDVPLAEEVEMYDLDISTQADVLKRTMRVTPGGAQAAIVVPGAPRYANSVSGNSLTGLEGVPQLAYVQQQITNSGGWVEATLHLTGPSQSAFLDLRIPSEGVNIDIAPTQYYSLRFSNLNEGGGASFEVSDTGGIRFQSTEVPGLSVVRVRIIAVGSEIRFYWDYTGSGAIPFYVATTALPFPMLATMTMIGAARAINIYTGSNILDPSVIYSVEQQIEDFGNPQKPVRVSATQISSIVGRGDSVTADL